jgi:hypothetical protein
MAPPLLAVVGQKRAHIFQGTLIEKAVLLAQPAQELLHLPALTADSGWG